MQTEKPLIVIGGGGHAKVAIDTCLAGGLPVAGFLSETPPPGNALVGVPYVGGMNKLNDANFRAEFTFLPAVGDQSARRQSAEAVIAGGGTLSPAVIHPSAIVSPHARIGAGTLVVAGAIINVDARIGAFCIVNTGCSIDHDCELEDGCQICPGARLAGTVSCGADVFVGTGAVIIPKISVGAKAVVAAGAVVVADVEAGTSVAGCPATPMATNGRP